jgi:ribosomal-protein-alanine N-acetyltransferase
MTSQQLDYSTLPFVVDPMRLEDIDQIMVIEREAFAGAPWTAGAYRHELTRNEMAHYYVVRRRYALSTVLPDGGGRVRRSLWRVIRPKGAQRFHAAAPPLPAILAYGGFWLMVDEAHISTIATAPAWRRKYLGELLLGVLIERARELGALYATLEVRAGNTAAQNLYGKYGFKQEGRRKRYYSDNGEDALIMTTSRLDQTSFQTELDALKDRLWQRLRADSS